MATPCGKIKGGYIVSAVSIFQFNRFRTCRKGNQLMTEAYAEYRDLARVHKCSEGMDSVLAMSLDVVKISTSSLEHI